MSIRRGLSGLVATAALGISLAAPSGALAFDVEIKADDSNNHFTPAEVTIAPGETVRWTFHPNAAGGPIAATHNVVVFDGPDWNADELSRSEYFSPDGLGGVSPAPGWHEYTFDAPGTYFFYCEVHSSEMYGTVTVQAEDPGPEPVPEPALKVAAKPKNVTVKPSKAANLKAIVKNVGDAAAAKVKVCVKAPKKLLKVKGKACANLKSVNAGAKKQAAFKLKPTKKAKGKAVNVKLVVTASNAPQQTVKAKVKVKKK